MFITFITLEQKMFFVTWLESHHTPKNIDFLQSFLSSKNEKTGPSNSPKNVKVTFKLEKVQMNLQIISACIMIILYLSASAN